MKLQDSLLLALAALLLLAPAGRAATPTFTSFDANGFLVSSNVAPWTIHNYDSQNVLWWKADPTGATDSTAAIQAAIAASANLIFPPGIYLIQPDVLVTKNNLKITGNRATLRPAATGTSMLYWRGTNVSFSGIEFDGSNVVNRAVEFVKGAAGLSFTDCTFRNVTQPGAQVMQSVGLRLTGNSSDITVDRCLFEDISAPNNGISRAIIASVVDADETNFFNLKVVNSTFRRYGNTADGDAIVIQNFTNDVHSLISGNYCEQQKRFAKIMSPGVTVSGNTIRNDYVTGDLPYAGISIYANDCLVENNLLIGGRSYAGLEVGSTFYPVTNAVVRGNTVRYEMGADLSAADGVQVIGASNANLTISGNVLNNTRVGIRMASSGRNFTVTGNTVDTTMQAGIRIDRDATTLASANTVLVSGNTLNGTGGNGIQLLYGTNVVCTDNTLKGSGGIYVGTSPDLVTPILWGNFDDSNTTDWRYKSYFRWDSTNNQLHVGTLSSVLAAGTSSLNVSPTFQVSSYDPAFNYSTRIQANWANTDSVVMTGPFLNRMWAFDATDYLLKLGNASGAVRIDSPVLYVPGAQTNTGPLLVIGATTFEAGTTIYGNGSTLTLYPAPGTGNSSLITWKDGSSGSARGSLGFNTGGGPMQLDVNGGGLNIGLPNAAWLTLTNSSALTETFAVSPTSGYSGTGTNSLSDDGTYKEIGLIKIDAADTGPGYTVHKLLPGSNVTFTTNNVGGVETVTIASSGSGTITGTNIYNFVLPLMTTDDTNVSIQVNGIDNTLLRQGAARSVIGRAANSAGNVADIQGGGPNTVLVDDGTSLQFGYITNPTGDVLPVLGGTGTFIDSPLSVDGTNILAQGTVTATNGFASDPPTGAASGLWQLGDYSAPFVRVGVDGTPYDLLTSASLIPNTMVSLTNATEVGLPFVSADLTGTNAVPTNSLAFDLVNVTTILIGGTNIADLFGPQAVTNYALVAGSGISIATNVSGTNVTWTVTSTASGAVSADLANWYSAVGAANYTPGGSYEEVNFGGSNPFTITLPDAGTYLVTAVVSWTVNQVSTSSWTLDLKLNCSEGGDVVGSNQQFGLGDAAGANFSGAINQVPITIRAKVTVSAAATVSVYAHWTSAGSSSTASINYQPSTLDYLKL